VFASNNYFFIFKSRRPDRVPDHLAIIDNKHLELTNVTNISPALVDSSPLAPADSERLCPLYVILLPVPGAVTTFPERTLTERSASVNKLLIA
jgi:hypothetical protein